MVSKNFSYFILSLLFIGLLGCATNSTKEQTKIRDLLNEKKYTAALEVLEKSKLKEEKSDQVLYLMELGSLYFYQGNFTQAALSWQKALELISAQYTKISQVTMSTVVSDTLKDFTPKDYEISYLYYHQALAFYFQYLKTQDRNFLLQARASIVAWDVFLQNIKIDKKFKNLYFDDFYARFFAGLIHESLAERSDLQIAYQLYKDAYQLFLLQAPSYVRFSNSHEQSFTYADELMKTVQSKENWREKLKALSLKNSKLTNPNFQKTRQLLASKILHLAKSIRKNELKKLQAEYDIKMDTADYNAIIMTHSGWMSPLVAKKIRLSISAASKDASTSQAVLTAVAQAGFLVFAAKVLGNSSNSNNSSAPAVNYSIYGTGDFTELTAGAASLEFELPSVTVPNVQTTQKISLTVQNLNKNLESELIPVQSFDDVIFQTTERQKALDLFLKGSRFAAKHITAMIGAYGIYKSMTAKNANNEGFAKLAAMASYMGAAKLISVSEHADVRFWSLLPSTVSFAPVTLPSKSESLQITLPDGHTQDFKVSKAALEAKQLQIIPVL